MTRPPTPRQKTLIDLLSLGLTNKEIAYRMGITPESVKTYLYNLRQKFPDLRSRYGVVRVALRDHERVVAIRLDEWIKAYGDALGPEALAGIRAILSDCVAEVLK